MSGLAGAGEELGGEQGEVVVDGKGFGFCVIKMFNGRPLHTPGGDAEGVILEGLELCDVGAGVGKPDGGGIKEEGMDYGLESKGYGFELLALGCASKSLEDIETGDGAGNEAGVGAKGEVGV